MFSTLHRDRAGSGKAQAFFAALATVGIPKVATKMERIEIFGETALLEVLRSNPNNHMVAHNHP